MYPDPTALVEGTVSRSELAQIRIFRNSFRNKVAFQKTHFFEISIEIKYLLTTLHRNPKDFLSETYAQTKRNIEQAHITTCVTHCYELCQPTLRSFEFSMSEAWT